MSVIKRYAPKRRKRLPIKLSISRKQAFALLLASALLVAALVSLIACPSDRIEPWRRNIHPREGEQIRATWWYRPRSYQGTPQGLSTLMPTWFYVEMVDGAPQVQSVEELGTGADMQSFVKAAHLEGTAVWGTVVSFTAATTAQLFEDATARQSFIDKLAGYVRELSLDGINFDFENFNPKYKQAYSQLVAACAAAMPEGTVISVCVTTKLDDPAGTNFYQCYDYATLAQAADFICLMAYDQHGWFSGDGAVAELGWVEEGIRNLLAEVGSEQVILGIPFYGRVFRFSSGSGSDADLTPLWPPGNPGVCTMYLRHVRQVLEEGAYTDVRGDVFEVSEIVTADEWDDAACVYITEFWDTQGRFHRMYYDKERSLELKAALAEQYSLAGWSVWQAEFAEQSQWEAVLRGLPVEQ